MTYRDAIRSKKLRSGRKEICVHNIDEETVVVTEEVIEFLPLWPPCLVHVHNYTKHGGKFAAIPSLTRICANLRTLWYLISVLVMLPEMWEMAIEGLSTNRQWMGWVLSFATNQGYSTKACFESKNNPYPVLRVQEIFETLGVQSGFSVANLVSLFALVPGLCILLSAHQMQTQNYPVSLDGVKMVMVIRMRSTGQLLFDDILDMSGEGGDGWQLRFVGITHDGTQRAPQKWKGKLFVRHGGKELVGWWVQDREWKVCWPLDGDLPETVYASWDILVYCRKHDASMDTLRDAYLQYIGGQTKCVVHGIAHQ
jgi:hypothetical protein